MENSSILKYSFQPDEVFISTSIDLKLVITNPANGNLINFRGGRNGDSIDIVFPIGNTETDLVETINFNTKVPTGITCAKSAFGNYFTIRFTNNSTKLQPGEQLTITFLAVPINSNCKPSTPAVVKITENLENEGIATVNIDKRPNNTLDIIAWVNPSIIALGMSSKLYWQSTGGTKVFIKPFNNDKGYREFPVGPPPSPGNCNVNIPSTTESQRTYTLTVYTSDQQHAQVPVTLTQNPPLITALTSDKSGSITVDDSMTLDWFFLWGTSSTIVSNSGLLLNNPLRGITVNPGHEVMDSYRNNYQNMPSTVYYELGVNGFKNMASKRVSINLLPVQMLYFKYTKRDGNVLSGIARNFDFPSWNAQRLDIKSDTLAVLTLYQPGGLTEVYYLGDGDTTHPQVQYFDYKSKGNGVYELSWVTANLVKLELNPGTTIPTEKIKSGTQDVTLSASATYILKGTAADGSVITSQLNITI